MAKQYNHIKKKPWQKNLYGNLDYPDNYTDKTFLEELRTNIDNNAVTVTKCMRGATVVTEEISMVTLFVLIFTYLHNQWIEPKVIFSNLSALAVLGFFYYRLNFKESLKTTVREDIRTLLIFLVFGYIFSPVLHTLTDTVSTDTIYSMSFLMMCTHLIFFDYGVSVAIVSNSLSLNAAIFSSICLASRLASPYHAFVLMTVAVECFVLYPVLKTKLHDNLLTKFILVILTTYLLHQVSPTMCILFSLLLLFINCLCPYLFVRWQRHKENIYGPWDEAIVQDVDNINQISFIQ